MAEYKLDLNRSDISDGEVKAVDVAGTKIALVALEGKLYALQGYCTHEQGILGDGYIDKKELICPMHAGAFDIETGKANESTSWVTDISTYACRVDEMTGEITVEM
ncbi:MAG: Rieske 2Fe-2S domain-containing protein [Candidatus Micrarchaeota archaeon]|nr:Rieske 2Fe-2S domain-containing protein [Candidatus Micrarchaeota archaeon]MDE1849155.1 Rieske 2Fe-2S domain-containing protein [Candidatus Micrarchaeota archaeon]